MPSATIATTVATGNRNPRTQGIPPITSESTVIRVKIMVPTVPRDERQPADINHVSGGPVASTDEYAGIEYAVLPVRDCRDITAY